MTNTEKQGINELVDKLNFKEDEIFELTKKNNKLEERIHTLEVYLEGAVNYLILNGDVDNPIIKDVENILHMTFNRTSNVSDDQQKYTHAIKLLKRCYDDWVYLPPLRTEIEKFLEEI